MKKKILSAALALCMVFGSAAALPEGTFVESTSVTANAEESKPTSGKCGKNVNWTLKNGVLTISGKGAMTDYYFDVTNPFRERTDIKSVIIKSGVTSIGAWTFTDCKNLTSVTIQSGVKSIGDYAFNECWEIESVTIPSSVTSIGSYAFQHTRWLVNQRMKNPLVVVNGILIDGSTCEGEVTIPNSVKSIAGDSFSGCTSLTKVTIPKSVKSIGNSAFSGCTSLKNVTIPSSVKSIGGFAFAGCTSFTKITIPSSVKSIYSYAFSNCSNLKSVTIPNSVTSIGSGAFQDCKGITKIIIPNSVTSIDDYVFSGCTSLTSVTIPSSVTSIGDCAFRWCTSLTNVIIPKSVKSIGESSFTDCESLKNVTIPDSVSNIGAAAFSGTKWFETQQNNNPLVIVNGILIDGTKCKGKVTIPSSVKSIGDSAFSSCSNITSVTIPDSVKSIGNSAFYECTNLTSVNIPKGVEDIGKMAFFSCSSLKSVTIPNTVTRIDDFAFIFCTSLTSVTIPNSVKSFGNEVFYGCSSLTSVTLPDSIKSIRGMAFWGCTSLKSITIPSSVTSIGEYAFGFYDNYGLKKVDGFTIYGYKGTAAEKYAKKNGFKFVARNTTEPKTVRYAGSDRAETATKISKAVNAKTSDTVILATGFDFHDALAAVPLASAYNAPLLLADRDNLSAKTLAEIKRLKAKNIIVVASTNSKDQNGNDAAIRNNVYKQLKGYKVTKITGSSYYETAKNVAKNLKTKTGKNPTSVFITTDKNYADALSASPVAAILGAPILYVDPKANLNATTKNYLVSIKKSVKDVYIVGGVNAVSKSVEKSVLSVLGKKSATRFAGDDRYATCIKINDYFKSTLTGKFVCVAKGYNFPDALAGGVFAAKQKAPLFLADKLDAKATISKTQANYLYIKNPSKLYIFGGETAVPTKLVQAIAKASI